MSHKSARSIRVKAEARQRPDVLWRDASGNRKAKLAGVSSEPVLSGGTQLSQLVAEADSHMIEMRKIVQ